MNNEQTRNLLWVIVLLLITLLLGLIFLAFLFVRTAPGQFPGLAGTSVFLTTESEGGTGGTPGGVPPAPTPIEGDPAVFLGLPAWIDTFSSSANWAEFDNECYRSEIKEGRFFMEAKGSLGIFCWELTWPEINRFYLEAKAQTEDVCADGGVYGLFFRGPDTSRGYLYGLSCDNRYGMYLWTGDSGALLAPLQTSDSIIQGGENRIGVLADGDAYSLYVNGIFLTQVRDPSFIDGVRIGFFIRTPEGEKTEVAFDDLTYWDLP